MPIEDDKKIEILLKEYETLRAEILDRMKISFSHLGYVGALAAFGAPFAKNFQREQLLIGLLGFTILCWISAINWMWLRNCSDQLRKIEEHINQYSGDKLLTWEGRVERLTKGVLRFPGTLDSLNADSRPAPNPEPPADPQAGR